MGKLEEIELNHPNSQEIISTRVLKDIDIDAFERYLECFSDY